MLKKLSTAVTVLMLAAVLAACGASAANPNPNPKQYNASHGYIDDGKTAIVTYVGIVNGNQYQLDMEVTLGRNERNMGTSFVLKNDKGEEGKPCVMKATPGVSAQMASCTFGALSFEVVDVGPKGRSYVMLHISGAMSVRSKN